MTFQRPQRVTVFGAREHGPSYRVRWRVDGKETSRSFRIKLQAEDFERELRRAVARGDRFDPVSGEPEAWSEGLSVLEFTQPWFRSQWDTWKPKTRKVNVENTVEALLVLTDEKPGAEREGLLRPLLTTALSQEEFPTPASTEERQALDWLRQHSLALKAVDPPAVVGAFEQLARNRDGSIAKPGNFSKKRAGVTRLLKAAFKKGLISSNPSVGVDSPNGLSARADQPVPLAEIPSPSQAQLLIMVIASASLQARRLVAYLATTLYAGLRPGEVNALRTTDLDLPASGWGAATVRRSASEVGERYTAGRHDRGVSEADRRARRVNGATKTKIDRVVPLHPDLVALIRQHLDLWPTTPGGLVFTTASGDLLSVNLSRNFTRAKKSLGWVGDHPLAESHHYSLRHTCASTMLQVLEVPKVAQRLGNSPEVVTRHYWHVINGPSEDEINSRIERLF